MTATPGKAPRKVISSMFLVTVPSSVEGSGCGVSVEAVVIVVVGVVVVVDVVVSGMCEQIAVGQYAMSE